MTPSDYRRMAPVPIIAGLLAMAFAYTVEVRRPHANVLSYGQHEWLTAHALKFARIWWQEGAFELDFLLMETPLDIEHPSLATRQVYPSYPPGAVLAPYAVAKVLGDEPSVALLMAFNRWSHLFIALCLSLAVWLWIPREDRLLRFVGGLLPGLFYLLLPGPMLWQQNVYFTDTAVIAPFALLLLAITLERVLGRPRSELLVGFAFLWGFATDWFFVSIALVLVVVRLGGLLTRTAEPASWPRRIAREVGAPALAACLAFGFYGWQLTKHSLWGSWLNKFVLRTYSTGDGAEAISSNFSAVVWGGFSKEQYGQNGNALLFAASVFAALFVVRSLRLHRAQLVGSDDLGSLPRASFLAVAALAPLLHTYLLKNHSYLHPFSVLKFAIPFCTIPFVLLPYSALRMLRASRKVTAGLTVAITSLGIAYVLNLHGRYAGLIPARNPEIARMGDFVRRTAGYDDVVFSRFAKAEPYPHEPHLLSHTLKLIHQVESVAQLATWVEGLPPGANVTWLGDTVLDSQPLGGDALWASAERASEGSLFLLRLSREHFLRSLAAIRDEARPDQ